MGIVIRQSIKTAVITFTGVFLGLIINLLSIRVFDKTELGFTQNLVKIALIVCYFCVLGFNYALIIYGQKYHKDHPKRASFLTISIVVPLICTGLITALYFIFKKQFIGFYHSGDELLLEKYYLLFPFLTILSAAMLWMEGYLQSIYKTAIQSLGREVINRIIYLILIILFAYQIISYEHFIWWFVILYIVPVLYLAFFIYKFDGFKVGYTKGDFSWKEVFHFISFSFNQTFVVISVVLIIQIDTVLIGPLAYDGLESIAVYGTAAFAISVIKNPIRALSVAALPSLSDSYQKSALKKMRIDYIKSATIMQLLVVFMSMGIVLCMNELQYCINLLKPGYESVGGIMLVLLIGHVIDVMGGLSLEVITLSKYFKYNTIYSLIGLTVIIILIYSWIAPYGLIGVAWASSIGMSLYAVAKVVFIYKRFKIQPLTGATFKTILFGILAFGVCYFLDIFENPLYNFALKGSLYALIFLVLAYKFKISEDFNEILRKYLPFLR